jgi:two-component system osmolarity sensor histidine kinase EnvZ
MFNEDVDSFSDIARQLLDVAGTGNNREPVTSADAFLSNGCSSAIDESLFAYDLKGDPRFTVPCASLDRLMSNPIETHLSTRRTPSNLTLHHFRNDGFFACETAAKV